ncbi:MAG: HNH endonuclease [Imperialibacter sp.]|uniref:HNH endonuclease n=1 Tax=Imperialibacter sp. TaxID=2038411 RepID=UPI0032EB7279
MKFYLGVTDNNWYRYLSSINPEDINFWQPGGTMNFKAISPGEPFLFKLKSPLNAIGGVGFFSSHTFLPTSLAWDIFKDRNGCASLAEFRKMILNYRNDKDNPNPKIGCIVLTNPIFFEQKDWIEVPANWSNSIVQGKSYGIEDTIGRAIWLKVSELLEKYMYLSSTQEEQTPFMVHEPEFPTYGKSILRKVRIGQGAFRVNVTDAYTRKCSVTGEKTLPVLQAAHIKPYYEAGPNHTSNGLLLRSDIHKLFDDGYITVTKDYKVEVSRRIREEFENGKEYYQYHGKELMILPQHEIDRPHLQYLDWHNTNEFEKWNQK